MDDEWNRAFFLSASNWCPVASLRLVEQNYDARSYIRLPHIEVLEISKLLDGDAFHTGNDPEVQTSSAEIDPGAHWHAPRVIALIPSLQATDRATGNPRVNEEVPDLRSSVLTALLMLSRQPDQLGAEIEPTSRFPLLGAIGDQPECCSCFMPSIPISLSFSKKR